MDKKQQLLSRFSRMKIGLSRVLNVDDDKSNIDNSTISSLTRPITLTLQSDSIYHNSVITAEGCPDPKQLPCIIRWYNCPSNDELSEIYTSTKSLKFQPNVQDAQHKIYCQWFPTDEGDDTSTLLPSKLAEIGPLKRNPALVQDAQSILDKGKGNFDIIIPQISNTEKQKLVIEGTKIHIYINTKNFKKQINPKSISSHLSSDELKSDELDFENSILDVTMIRYLHSMNEQYDNDNDEEDDDEEDDDEDNVWMQTYRIKPEYRVTLSRDNLLSFQIENGKGSIMLKAFSATLRERDILAIVIQALADAKKKRKEKKKRSQDLIQLRIDVLDDSNGYGTNKINQANKIQKLQIKLAHIHERMVDLQKENIYLSAEKDKFVTSLDRLREAGLLKRDEMNKLSEENMQYCLDMNKEKERKQELMDRIELLENDLQSQQEEMRQEHNKNIDVESKELILKNEIDGLTKKLELRDSKLAEYEMEIVNLEDDRNQFRLTLNHLNAHVGKVQDDKSQMDLDFGSLNEEMIKYKTESRKYKSMYNKQLSQFESLQIDFDNLNKQLCIQHQEYDKKKVELTSNQVEIKELSEQIKQMKLLKIKLNDIQYEIAKKDENIQRLKIENEQLRSDLNAENTESTKNSHKIRILSKKLDKATTKNAKLQSQIDEFEDRVTDSVARALYKELQRELEDYKQKLNDMIKERDELTSQVSKFQTLNKDFKQMVDKLTSENENFSDEINELQTHNTFWKNKVKSMREEIKKLHSQPVFQHQIQLHLQQQQQQLQQQQNRTPSPVNSINGDVNSFNHKRHYAKSDNDINVSDIDMETRSKFEKKIKALEKEKNEALLVVSQLKKALNNELQKANKINMKNKMLYSHTHEEVKTLVRKNTALMRLANELADTVADKEHNIMHLKKVMKLLGSRVTELETTNKGLKQEINSVDHEINVLQNTHYTAENNQIFQKTPTLIIAKNVKQSQSIQ